MTPRPKTLGKLARNSALLLTCGRMVTRVLAVIQLVIFYQIQGRADTGVIGIGLAALATVDVFSQFGVRKALVQRPGDIDAFLPMGYTAEIIRGLLVGAVLFTLAPAIADWFNSEEAENVLKAFAIIPAVRGVTSISLVKLERALDFRRLVFLDLAGPIVDFIVTIVCLVTYPSVYALVWGKIAGSACSSIVSHLIVIDRIRPGWNLSFFWELNRFGRWVLLTGIIGLLLTRGSDFIAGRFVSTAEFGDLTLATFLAIMPMMEVNNILNRVALPAYAQVQNDITRLRRVFTATFLTATLAIITLMLGIVFAAPGLVYSLRGRDDKEFIWLIQLLAVWGACRALGGATSSVFMACGKPNYVSKYHLLMLVMMAITIVPMTKQAGLLGVGVTLASIGLTAQALRYRLVSRLIECKSSVLYRQTAPAFASALMAYISVYIFEFSTQQAISRSYQILLIPPIGISVFILNILIWNKLTGSMIFTTVRGVLRGRLSIIS